MKSLLIVVASALLWTGCATHYGASDDMDRDYRPVPINPNTGWGSVPDVENPALLPGAQVPEGGVGNGP